jgi:hypothetical protein
MEFETTINLSVKRDLAWKFWTDVSNWPVVDPSAELVELHGPFAAGSIGRTKPADPTHRLEVNRCRGGNLCGDPDRPSGSPGEIPLDFRGFTDWNAMTQRVTMEGDQVDNYREGFEATRWRTRRNEETGRRY